MKRIMKSSTEVHDSSRSIKNEGFNVLSPRSKDPQLCQISPTQRNSLTLAYTPYRPCTTASCEETELTILDLSVPNRNGRKVPNWGVQKFESWATSTKICKEKLWKKEKLSIQSDEENPWVLATMRWAKLDRKRTPLWNRRDVYLQKHCRFYMFKCEAGGRHQGTWSRLCKGTLARKEQTQRQTMTNI